MPTAFFHILSTNVHWQIGIFASVFIKIVMRHYLFAIYLVFTLSAATAQKKMSLAECLQFGIDRNLSLKTQAGNIEKGKHAISENRARLLPQINLAGAFNDNFNPPVSVTDGTAYGKTYNVTKTLQYNSSAAVQLQMPLYSQTSLTAIEISKTLDQINQLTYEKAREDLMMQISKLYYLIQNTEEQIGIIKENITRIEELKGITEAFYDNGMAMEVDVKRVSVNLENLKVQHDNALSMLQQQYNILKYTLDYPEAESIAVMPAEPDKLYATEASGLNHDMYELQLLRTQQDLAQQQVKLARQGYLPTLTLTGSWAYSAYTDKFHHWWHSGESNHWYNSNGIGLSLRLPIFDGFEKRAKIRKAKVESDNARIAYENSLKNLETQYVNALNDIANNRRNFQKQRDNYLLAEDVYKVTSVQYREGTASMTAVLQDEMSMSDAQNNYLTAHYNYMVSNLTLLKLTGKLDQLLK